MSVCKDKEHRPGNAKIAAMLGRSHHCRQKLKTALGGKVVAAANESDLPTRVLEIIENAPRYAEGRGVHLDVRYQRDLPAVLRLAQIKMEH